jgi:hypothetical protein
VGSLSHSLTLQKKNAADLEIIIVGWWGSKAGAKRDDVMLDSNEMFVLHLPHCGYKIIEAHDTCHL